MEIDKIKKCFKDMFADALTDNHENWNDTEAITDDQRMLYTSEFIYIITSGTDYVHSARRNWLKPCNGFEELIRSVDDNIDKE